MQPYQSSCLVSVETGPIPFLEDLRNRCLGISENRMGIAARDRPRKQIEEMAFQQQDFTDDQNIIYFIWGHYHHLSFRTSCCFTSSSIFALKRLISAGKNLFLKVMQVFLLFIFPSEIRCLKYLSSRNHCANLVSVSIERTPAVVLGYRTRSSLEMPLIFSIFQQHIFDTSSNPTLQNSQLLMTSSRQIGDRKARNTFFKMQPQMFFSYRGLVILFLLRTLFVVGPRSTYLQGLASIFTQTLHSFSCGTESNSAFTAFGWFDPSMVLSESISCQEELTGLMFAKRLFKKICCFTKSQYRGVCIGIKGVCRGANQRNGRKFQQASCWLALYYAACIIVLYGQSSHIMCLAVEKQAQEGHTLRTAGKVTDHDLWEIIFAILVRDIWNTRSQIATPNHIQPVQGTASGINNLVHIQPNPEL